MTLLQSDRQMKLSAPGLGDTLLVRSFRGDEAVSRLFRYELELVSTMPKLPFKKLLGQPVGLELQTPGAPRYFHGRVSRMEQVRLHGDGLATYHMELVPWLWFLGLTSDCRSYQNLSVQDIITQVFTFYGMTDFEFRGLSRGQETREYCVQYRETALNFVSRLLEEEGIWYYFEHDGSRHLLVLADSPSQHTPCPGQGKARFSKGSLTAWHDEEVIHEASWSEEVQTSGIALRDFNFLSPALTLDSSVAEAEGYEQYDYPGGYTVQSQGDGLVAVRLEEQSQAFGRLSGSSSCRPLCPGFRIELVGFPRADVEADQVLLSVSHVATQAIVSGGQDGELAFSYENHFTSLPYSVPFRPARQTPKPRVEGSQTAIVVGDKTKEARKNLGEQRKEGDRASEQREIRSSTEEEITTDEYGRVKVQFYWDRFADSSCWIRVAHHWAGMQYGTFFIPRHGEEVIVDFLEGDPDRPIIVGRVYNAHHMPPYKLPEDRTKSTIKSNSFPTGNGSNEFRYEDKAGEEEIFLHAQKDFNETVLNNHSTSVTANQTISVGGDQATSVTGDKSNSVTGNCLLQVKKDYTEVVNDGNYHTTVKTGTHTIDVETGTSTQNVKGDHTLHVSTGNEIINVDTGNCTVTVKAGSYGVTTNAGTITMDAKVNQVSVHGMNVTVKADVSIGLEVGANKITLSPAGITIQGTLVTINGSLVTVAASGINTISGAVVKIN